MGLLFHARQRFVARYARAGRDGRGEEEGEARDDEEGGGARVGGRGGRGAGSGGRGSGGGGAGRRVAGRAG